jgi:hypothetical protein
VNLRLRLKKRQSVQCSRFLWKHSCLLSVCVIMGHTSTLGKCYRLLTAWQQHPNDVLRPAHAFSNMSLIFKLRHTVWFFCIQNWIKVFYIYSNRETFLCHFQLLCWLIILSSHLSNAQIVDYSLPWIYMILKRDNPIFKFFKENSPFSENIKVVYSSYFQWWRLSQGPGACQTSILPLSYTLNCQTIFNEWNYYFPKNSK